MDKILVHLYKNYCDSIGKKCYIYNIDRDMNELSQWLVRNKKIGNDYSEYLCYNRIPIFDGDTVELNKSVFDSIMTDQNQIVSEFAHTMDLPKSNLINIDGITYIYNEKGIIDLYESNYTITHNPYSKEYYSILPHIHTSGLNICLGVFGKVYDKDYQQKIKMLRNFNESLIGTTLEYDKVDDNYFCIVKSNNKILYKEKTYIKNK